MDGFVAVDCWSVVLWTKGREVAEGWYGMVDDRRGRGGQKPGSVATTTVLWGEADETPDVVLCRRRERKRGVGQWMVAPRLGLESTSWVKVQGCREQPETVQIKEGYRGVE
jgi:hypothetical protein